MLTDCLSECRCVQTSLGFTVLTSFRCLLLRLWPNVVTPVMFITFVTKCYYTSDLYYEYLPITPEAHRLESTATFYPAWGTASQVGGDCERGAQDPKAHLGNHSETGREQTGVAILCYCPTCVTAFMGMSEWRLLHLWIVITLVPPTGRP